MYRVCWNWVHPTSCAVASSVWLQSIDFIYTLFSFRTLCLFYQAVGIFLGIHFPCAYQLSYFLFASLQFKISLPCAFSGNSFYYLFTLSNGSYSQVLKHDQVSPIKRKKKIVPGNSNKKIFPWIHIFSLPSLPSKPFLKDPSSYYSGHFLTSYC